MNKSEEAVIQLLLLNSPWTIENWIKLGQLKSSPSNQDILTTQESPQSNPYTLKSFFPNQCEDTHMDVGETLKLIARLCSSSEYLLAERLAEIARPWQEEPHAVAWVEYYLGFAKKNQGRNQDSLVHFAESHQTYRISYCTYELALHYQNEDRILAQKLFLECLVDGPEMSDEARSYAQKWLDDFFDPVLYLRNNPELNGMGDSDLLKHYMNYGLQEGRTGSVHDIRSRLERLNKDLPASFRWESYLTLNSDLKEILGMSTTVLETECLLKDHYVKHGKEEHRRYKLSIDGADHTDDLYVKQKSFLERIAFSELQDFLATGSTMDFGIEGQTPLVSIVVIVYNKAHLTLQCIRAIHDSCLKNIELIIIDNHSSDQTQELFSRLKGSVRTLRNNENLHFLRACNQAFGMVEGRYIALVNNDALVAPNCFSRAIECAHRYDDQAIVGGKVLHLDGYIQDAGSVVFNDGSVKGLGRRTPPDSSLYSFERKVDYVSGCFLLVSTDIVNRLKGFDESFAPAYYEETDFCFRARDLGIPTIYCPECVIRHYEFASSSSIASSWAKQQMEANQKLFLERHRNQLLTSLSPGQFNSEDIASIMHGYVPDYGRVLIIDDQFPDSSTGSGFSRSKDIVDLLESRSSFCTLFATDPVRSKSHLMKPSISCELIECGHEGLEEFLASRQRFYDFVVVSRSHNHDLFSSVSSKAFPDGYRPFIIYDLESLFSIRNYSLEHLVATGSILKISSPEELVPVAEEEINRLTIADAVLCVSDFERKIVSMCLPSIKTHIVGHAFSHEQKIHERSFFGGDAIGFLGAVHEVSSPNYDSLSWLASEILPNLVASFSGSPPRLLLAGSITCVKAIELIKSLMEQYHFIEWLGKVDDLEQYFARCRLFIAPTRYAAGIPHKIHQASAYCVPTVTTNLIAMQMQWSNGYEILAADQPLEFSQLVYQLYTDQALWERIRSNMASRMRRECSFDNYHAAIKLLMTEK